MADENAKRHHTIMIKSIGFFGVEKVKPNRPMQRPMVEKELWLLESGVRFAANGSLNEIKSLQNGFGGEVITHDSRPEGPANIYIFIYIYIYIYTLFVLQFSW